MGSLSAPASQRHDAGAYAHRAQSSATYGSVVIEIIFNWPGWDAPEVTSGDNPAIIGARLPSVPSFFHFGEPAR